MREHYHSSDEFKVTKSRFYVWWLLIFNGYTLEVIFRKPKPSLFGRVKYSNVWVLKQRVSKDDDTKQKQ